MQIRITWMQILIRLSLLYGSRTPTFQTILRVGKYQNNPCTVLTPVPIPDWDAGCRNADAGGLDADVDAPIAQLCYATLPFLCRFGTGFLNCDTDLDPAFHFDGHVSGLHTAYKYGLSHHAFLLCTYGNVADLLLYLVEVGAGSWGLVYCGNPCVSDRRLPDSWPSSCC